MDKPDYIIREVRAGTNEYEVTKWIGGKNPDEIYRCLHNKVNNRWSCSCPARMFTCKHIGMVKDWIKKGKKSFIDEKPMRNFIKQLFSEGRKI